MKYDAAADIMGNLLFSVNKAAYRKCGMDLRSLKEKLLSEYKAIIERASSIGDKNRLITSYLLAAYFIAMNRSSGLSPEENYAVLETGLKNSRIFKLLCGNGNTYLSENKMESRRQWDIETHERRYKNDWVVSFIEGNGDYVFGFDYHECGVCKLCADEGCFELAKYMCRLDSLMVELMGTRLERTKTLAEGGELCDFRFKR